MTSLEVAASRNTEVSTSATVGSWRMPRSSTARIGPTLHRATRPKVSSCESLSPRSEVMPTPIARMNGTVMGPVVTPPESKPTGMKDSGVKRATPKVTK